MELLDSLDLLELLESLELQLPLLFTPHGVAAYFFKFV